MVTPTSATQFEMGISSTEVSEEGGTVASNRSPSSSNKLWWHKCKETARLRKCAERRSERTEMATRLEREWRKQLHYINLIGESSMKIFNYISMHFLNL